MVAVPRFKTVGNAVAVRNEADTENARMIALEILLSGGTLAAGKILTSDASGLGSWQTNPAIQAAADAQTAADNAATAASNAQTTANTANTTANTAVTNAAAAQTTANTAVSAAAAADAAAVAAGVAAAAAAATAAAAGVTATAALGAAALAQATADGANTLAGTAQTTANNALAVAADAMPKMMRIFHDEFTISVGTRTKGLSTLSPWNYMVWTATNGATWNSEVTLRGGTWRFTLQVQKRPDAPRVSISIGAAILADPLDLYAAANDLMFEANYTGVELGDGVHAVTMIVNGRNASNTTGYIFAPLKLFGIRTGS